MSPYIHHIIQTLKTVPDPEPGSTQSANNLETVKTLTKFAGKFGDELLGTSQVERRTEREKGVQIGQLGVERAYLDSLYSLITTKTTLLLSDSVN